MVSDVREVSVDVDEMVITEVVLDEVLISEVSLDDEVVESEQVLEVSEKEYEIVEELDEDSLLMKYMKNRVLRGYPLVEHGGTS